MALKKESSSYAAEEIHTILGPESSFEGKLVFNGGRVRIDGHFKGEIRTESTLIIGEAAKVEANVDVGSIIINGEVNGDVVAKHSVSIEKPGIVRGTITTPELMIEKGVIFEGTCKMERASGKDGGGAKVQLLTQDKDDGNKKK